MSGEQIVDPVTGEVVNLTPPVTNDTGVSVLTTSDEEKSELKEAAEVMKEEKVDPKVEMMNKLESLRADRPISEIPLNDKYWEYKKEIDHLV